MSNTRNRCEGHVKMSITNELVMLIGLSGM